MAPWAADGISPPSAPGFAARVGGGAVNAWNDLPLEFMSYRLPSWTPQSLAENIEVVFAARETDPKGGSPFAELPQCETVRQLNRGVVRWFDGRQAEGRRIFAEVLREAPGNPLVRRVIWSVDEMSDAQVGLGVSGAR